jgi:trans-aconitate methyltransferase
MQLSVAKALIINGIQGRTFPQQWMELGSGTGLFTQALSEILPPTSTITAVDKDRSALTKIQLSNAVELLTIASDFNSLPDVSQQDGILMANSLHYVKEQVNFLSRLRTRYLKPSGVIILVEYDLLTSNAWVPYPIPTSKLSEIATDAGFAGIQLLSTVPSRLNASEIYSAVLKQ